MSIPEQKRESLADDVEMLLDAGESPKSIVKRVGYTQQASLCRRLARHGRYDLTRRLGWAERIEHTIPEHGTTARYRTHACRCDACRDAMEAYNRDQRRASLRARRASR